MVALERVLYGLSVSSPVFSVSYFFFPLTIEFITPLGILHHVRLGVHYAPGCVRLRICDTVAHEGCGLPTGRQPLKPLVSL